VDLEDSVELFEKFCLNLSEFTLPRLKIGECADFIVQALVNTKNEKSKIGVSIFVKNLS
jgi:hypothetical protein